MPSTQRLVELRIHGVSGTPPEDTLQSSDVVQIAGDDLSRIFRRADDRGRAEGYGKDHLVEAFHWGRHTAGTWRQGLWFLLTPFGLINVAQFMLPRPRSGLGYLTHALAGAFLRFLGLVASLLFAGSVTIVLVDLAARQWVLVDRFGGRSGSAAQAVSGHAAGWVIVVAVVLVVVVLWLLARLGRRSGALGAAPESGHGAHPPSDLARAGFYSGDPNVPALSFLHIGAALAVVAYVALGALGTSGEAGSAGRLAGWFTAGLVGLVAVIVLVIGDPEDSARVRHGAASKRRRTISNVVGYAAAGMGAAALLTTLALVIRFSGEVSAAAVVPPGESLKELASSTAVARAVLAAGAVGLAGMALSSVPLGWATRYARWADHDPPTPQPFRRFLGGHCSLVVAATGVFLAAGFSALLTYGTQALLNRFVASGRSVTLTVPVVLQRVAYAYGLLVPFLVVVGACVLVGVAAHGRALRPDVGRDFGEIPVATTPVSDRVPDREWIARIANATARARVKEVLPGIMTLFAAIGAVLTTAMVVAEAGTLPCDRNPECPVHPLGRVWWLSPTKLVPSDSEPSGTAAVMWVGTSLLILLAGRLLLLGRTSVTSPEQRRKSNVVWDVISFWPRSVQPFAPWPYSQSVVADLVERIRHHLGPSRGPGPSRGQPPSEPVVVLAAHSQGTLLAVAALLWLTPQERDRVGLVTYGSQLRLQYARAFPAFVDYRVLRWVWTGLGRRWIGLYRDTDPIGGPALSWYHRWDEGERPSSRSFASPTESREDWVSRLSGVRRSGPEWRLLDPASPPHRNAQLAGFGQLLGHSGYWDDPAFERAVAKVGGALRRPRPDRGVAAAGVVPNGSAPQGISPDTVVGILVGAPPALAVGWLLARPWGRQRNRE